MEKSGLICMGHLTMDDISQLKKNNIYEDRMGGACLYSALGAAVWSKGVMMISKIGDNYNVKALKEIAKQKKINIDYVTEQSGNGIKLLIMYDSKNRRTFIPRKESGNYYEWSPCAVDIPDEVIEKKLVFHITPIPVEIQKSIVNRVKKKYGIITLDPDEADIAFEKMHLWKEVLCKIDYFILNEDELKKFFWCSNQSDFEIDINKIIDLCDKYSIKNMILKRAEKGVIIVDEDRKIIIAKAYPAKCVDCTGAGDAFAGGFGYAISKGKTIYEAMIYGCVSSSFAIEAIGIDRLVNCNIQEAKKRYVEMSKEYEEDNLCINKAI